MTDQTERSTALPDNEKQLAGRVAFIIGVGFALACTSFLIDFFPQGLSAVIFETRMVKWLAISGVTSLGLVLVGLGVLPTRGLRFSAVDIGVGGFLAWALVTGLWTPDTQAYWFSVVHLGQMFVAYLFVRIVDPKCVRLMIEGLAVAGVLITLLLIALNLSDGFDGGFGNENFAAEFLSILTVLLSMLTIIGWREKVYRRATAYAVVAGLGALYLLFLAPTNLQYLGFAGAVGLVLWWISTRVFAGVAALAVVGVIAVAFLAPELADRLPVTFRDRAQIWVNSVLLAMQMPISGHGLGSFFYLYPTVQDSFLDATPFLGAPAFNNFLRNATASENEFLHVFVEMGVIGVFLAGAVLVTAAVRVMRLPFAHTGFACGVTLANVVAVSLVSFPLQNPAPALVATLMLACVAGLVRAPADTPSGKPARLSIYGIVVVSLILTILLVPPLRASWSFAFAEAHDGLGDKSAATQLVLRTIEHSSLDPRWRLRAFNQAVIDPERESLNIDLDELFATSSTASPQQPLLLDLRLKQLLSTKGLVLSLDEIEGMLAALKQSSGRSRANAHILEAQLALQLEDRERAERAIRRARSRLLVSPDSLDETNVVNIEGLERQLGIELPPRD